MPKKGLGYRNPTQTRETAFRCDPVTPEVRAILREPTDLDQGQISQALTKTDEINAPVHQNSDDPSANPSTVVTPVAETWIAALNASSDVPGAVKCPQCGATTGPPTTSELLDQHKFLRLKQIIAPLGPLPVSRSTFLLRVKQGLYPRPFHPSPGVAAWKLSDILELLRRITNV